MQNSLQVQYSERGGTWVAQSRKHLILDVRV